MDEDGMPAPSPFPKKFGIVGDEALVEVNDGTCGGFANENGEREVVEEVVVGTAGTLGMSVDGMAAGVEVEGSEKPEVVVEVAVAVPLTESLVLGGVAKEKVEVFDLPGRVQSSDFPSAATADTGVSVIVGTDNGLVPSSEAVTLVGISAGFWGGP